jgi:hypothetical protein
LVLGTHGTSVFIIDDISPLRQITPEIIKKKIHFFDTKPTVMIDQFEFSGSFGAKTQFVGRYP